MARSLEQHRDTLLMLLPRGSAYSKDIDSNIGKFFTGLAEEFRRYEQRLEQLIEESDPRTVFELIDDWESDWGLPTTCTGPLPTIEARRQALVDRIVNIADQSRQTYIDRAAQLGYTITITEYSAGDSVPGLPGVPTADAAFVVQINAPLETVRDRDFGDVMGEPFGWWGNELLECSLNQIAQTHHVLLFSYT